jgi:hypothetical protein
MIDIIIAIVLILAMFLVGSIILLKEIAEAFNLKGEMKMTETRQTVFRQTKEEYKELKRDAYAHNMNVSEYIRYLVAKERKEREK